LGSSLADDKSALPWTDRTGDILARKHGVEGWKDLLNSFKWYGKEGIAWLHKEKWDVFLVWI